MASIERSTESPAAFVAPEIERAAVTILAQSRAHHDGLAAWVRQITASPDYREMLPSELYVAIQDERALHDDAGRDEADTNRRRQADAAVASLAHEVVLFRRAGRPTGDVARPLAGFVVTTSLAAAVAEYVQAVAAAWADFAQAQREA